MNNWSLDGAKYSEALRRRWLIVAIFAGLGLFAAIWLGERSHEYSAESAIVLVTQDANQSNAVNSNAQLTVQSADLPTLAHTSTVLSDVAHRIGYTGDPTHLDSRIRAHITLLSSIMPIDYTSNTAKEAVKGANAVADALTAYYQTISTSRLNKLIADLQSQIKSKNDSLASLNLQIAQVSAANPYLDVRSGASSLNGQIVDLKARKVAAEQSAAGDAAAASVLARLLNDVRPLASTEIAEASPAFRNLRDQYAKDLAQLAHLKTVYPSGYPGLPGLQDETNRDKAQVLALQRNIALTSPITSKSYATVLDEKMQADAKVQSDLAQEQRIAREIDAQTAALTQNSVENVSVAELRRNRDAAEASFTQLAARLTTAQADRAAAASTGAISVIARATTATEKTLSKGREAGAALFVLALAAGFGLIYLLEIFDMRLNSNRRIADAFGTQVFNTIG